MYWHVALPPVTASFLPQELLMVFTVQCTARHWSVLHPKAGDATRYARGADAFDAAAALALEHHRRTGQRSTVRVEALGSTVDALHVGD